MGATRKLLAYLFHFRIHVLLVCSMMFAQLYAQNYTVPVVFHIISDNPAAITDQQILNAVQDLNNAFSHAGPYAAGNGGVNTGIRFCLAKVDPDGGISSGITRTQSVLGKYDQDIEDDQLKKLVSWNTDRYCNIWLIDSVRNEYYTTFSCGNWNRLKNKTYSSFLPGGDFRDGIVTNEFGAPLAMLMGSYLGLSTTFTRGTCTNNNCNTDGDGVCDTPPASAPGNNCSPFQNTCSSDTLSGFGTDVPDYTSNFMSFSGTCSNSFTQGQAAKMRTTLTGARNSLLAQNTCDPPCTENITASFTRDNWLPAAGTLIHFTATATGGTNFQWTVNGIAAGGNSANFNYSFPQKGKYKVLLKVFNANSNCFASYSDSVMVGCGIMARFTPDKRLIASKDNIQTDSIYFSNLSVGANAYQWWMSNDAGMAAQTISTAVNLNQVFHAPGKYALWLVASSGGCTDTTEKFNFTVKDPTADGTISFTDVQCYEKTKVLVNMSVCNNGYVAIPAGAPVSFYDGNPATGAAKRLGPVFITPAPVAGNCCASFSTVIDIGTPGLNQLYAVFNDNGTAIPVVLPNNAIPEINYTNNTAVANNFQFKASVNPPNATLEPGDTLRLSGNGTPGTAGQFVWAPIPELSCADCGSPVFTAGKKDVTEQVIVTSSYGCVDSAITVLKVPVADDYTIQIDSILCAKNDSVLILVTVCNQFKRGTVPDGMKISFYDGDPGIASSALLPPVYTMHTGNNEKCSSFSTYLKAIRSGLYYAVINDSGMNAPVQLPTDSLFPEKDYTNNRSSASYQPGQVLLLPADTSLYIKQSFTENILSTIYDPASILWDNGQGYTLSCNNCPSPVVTVTGESSVTMHMLNEFGCMLEGTTRVKIFPPDFSTEILETHCFTNDSLLVKFNICINNGYENIFAGVPVSFYDGEWGSAGSKLLQPGFVTDNMGAGNCAPFIMKIEKPQSGFLSVVVNDKGNPGSIIPDTAYVETDYSNNSSVATVVPFSVTVTPSDTTVDRLTAVPVHFEVSGGQLSRFNWSSTENISCADCMSPVITPAHSSQYELEVVNEYSCTAKALVQIHTTAGGKVSIPNAFTPNGDGHNDVLYIMGSQDIKQIQEFNIFDRWGYTVFSAHHVAANDPQYGWNGLVNGNKSAAGAYVYVAIIEMKDGSKQTFKGSIVLIQ